MKIIITGGAGFIASHVADAYIEAGHKVVIIDNLLTGFRRNINPKATFYKADIRDRAAMDKIFRKERPEIVNHHAAIAEVIKSIRDPIPTLQTNVIGITNVLVAFGTYSKGKNRKFIFSSTGGAFVPAEGTPIPFKEKDASMALSPYGLSKELGESVIKFYAAHFGFNYFIFRYPNVYGPRQNPKGEAGVTAIFGLLMKEGKQPIIFGDGSKARDYVYVGDVAHANVAALRKGNRVTVSLGWGKPISDRMIFDAVARATGFTGKPKFAPYRKGEIYKVALSHANAKKILGWEPKVTLQEGVQNVVDSL